ncbi:SDR family NAD(P)-dependent oxidoreductase [Speluncibacter jeojiensis]|uniref:SDR family NAD(P)-dependent oxidoreductase n=1 Tax=Speluncibacter jeojiensis TaxID=2710754 RepID=A0A9X4LZM8_9ACTN|nr:SDR family NAD(P)-dependent oxidoreductase [Corynebacteriales bacterium D3-21]
MPAIAVVGAGPGMGLAIARIFGSHGFDVALLSRSQANLDAHAATLSSEGITAKGFAADVLDTDSLTGALESAAQHFGGIDVLEYSPGGPEPKFLTPTRVTAADVDLQMRYLVYGAIAATAVVLPAMRRAGAGTLLFTTGAGSVDPTPMLGDINTAGAALRSWVLNLHKEIEPEGIQAAHVAIGAWIGDRAPEGTPSATADQISPLYWDLHVQRDQAEKIFTP